jgi:hypothetical protein
MMAKLTSVVNVLLIWYPSLNYDVIFFLHDVLTIFCNKFYCSFIVLGSWCKTAEILDVSDLLLGGHVNCYTVLASFKIG